MEKQENQIQITGQLSFLLISLFFLKNDMKKNKSGDPEKSKYIKIKVKRTEWPFYNIIKAHTSVKLEQKEININKYTDGSMWVCEFDIVHLAMKQQVKFSVNEFVAIQFVI